MGAVAILQTFPHAAQTVQHKAVQRAEGRAEFLAAAAGGLGRRHRHQQADDQVGPQGIQPQQPVVTRQKGRHNGTDDDRDADG